MTTATDEQVEAFVERVERIKAYYEPRITVWLTEVGTRLGELGWTWHGPHELEGDDFRWYILIQRPGTTEDNDAIDVTIEIPEGPSYGDDELPLGVAIGVTIVEYGGRILGGYQPYNFTPQCWVDADDDGAIAERFNLLLNDEELDALVRFINEDCRERDR